jgi:hypothetical protein
MTILWEIVSISWEILWYLENLYYVAKIIGMSEKIFSTPKMVHWPKIFWRRGGGGRQKKFSPEKIFLH